MNILVSMFEIKFPDKSSFFKDASEENCATFSVTISLFASDSVLSLFSDPKQLGDSEEMRLSFNDSEVRDVWWENTRSVRVVSTLWSMESVRSADWFQNSWSGMVVNSLPLNNVNSGWSANDNYISRLKSMISMMISIMMMMMIRYKVNVKENCTY